MCNWIQTFQYTFKDIEMENGKKKSCIDIQIAEI